VNNEGGSTAEREDGRGAVSEQATEIRLASRPTGAPSHENFEITEVDTPTPGDGQVLVRNLVMSVDPAMRGRMNDVPSYVPPFELGKPLTGGAVGEVVESHADRVPAGTLLRHQAGWRTHAALDPARAEIVDGAAAPVSAYLGVLGMPGLTAYVGLTRIAAFAEGDAVFVSGAAGAVGSLAGQLAKRRGASRVVGSAGSADKVRHVTEDLGFDAAFNYRDGAVADLLTMAAPDGIDVYFDNVGGEHLEAAIGALNPFGRIAACGAISTYNATEPVPGPRNMFNFVKRKLAMRGFIVMDHADLDEAFRAEVAPLVADGRIRYEETVVDGLASAPQALIDLLGGANTGKMIVRIAER
jgi:NADPH-dependent curcumin reductase CurA